MGLGSGLAGAGLAGGSGGGGGAHRPSASNGCAPACLLACFFASGRLGGGSKDLPGVAHLGWPENAGSTAGPNLFALVDIQQPQRISIQLGLVAKSIGGLWCSYLTIFLSPDCAFPQWPACPIPRDPSLCQDPRLPLGKATSVIIVGPTQKSHAHRRICSSENHLHNRPTAKTKVPTDIDLLVTQARSTCARYVQHNPTDRQSEGRTPSGK